MAVINVPSYLIEGDADGLLFNVSPQGHALNKFGILGIFE